MHFISFEGIDGAGKSTLIQHIEQFLQNQGQKTLKIRQPGSTPLGEEIRDILQHRDIEVNPKTESLLFIASFIQALETLIKPALQEGTWVLSDRFFDSTRAYQGAGRELGRSRIDEIIKASLAYDLQNTPTRTYLLDLPVEIAQERLCRPERKLDKIEAAGIEFQRRLRTEYLQMAKESPERFVILQSHLTPKELENACQKDIQSLINQKD